MVIAKREAPARVNLDARDMAVDFSVDFSGMLLQIGGLHILDRMELSLSSL